MSKAADMAKVSVKGGFHLLWGLVASTIISAIGAIVIARLLGESNYGLYTVALAAPNFIATFRDWGIDSAIVKYTAQYNAGDKTDHIRGIFVSGLIFELAVGLILSVFCFSLSSFLATSMFQRPTIAPLIQIAAFTILTGAILNTVTAAFTGIEKMEMNSVMLICQSLIKTFLVISLVVVGLDTSGAIMGYVAALLIACLIGGLLVWRVYRVLPHSPTSNLEIVHNTKIMLKYGLPLSVGIILSGFLTQFYTFLMAVYVTDNAIIGNYSVASNFAVLITFFSTPVATMMLPAFSKLDPQKDKETLKNVFRFSVKYATLLVVPATVMIMALSGPAIATLFAGKYAVAPLFLSLLAINYLYAAVGYLSTSNLMSGQGQTKIQLKLTALTAAIGFPLGFVLISQFGIVGLIVTSLIAGVPSLLISLLWVKKHYDVSIDWMSSVKILLSSTIAAVLTSLSISQLNLVSWIQLIVGAVIFSFSFIIASLLTKAIDEADILNLREMLSGLGPLLRILDLPLGLIEKIKTITDSLKTKILSLL